MKRSLDKTIRGLQKLAVQDIPHRPVLYFKGMKKTIAEAALEMQRVIETFQQWDKDEDNSSDLHYALRSMPLDLNSLEYAMKQVAGLVHQINMAIEALEAEVGLRRVVENFVDWIAGDYNLSVLHRLAAEHNNENTISELEYLAQDKGWDKSSHFVADYMKMMRLAKLISDRVNRAHESLQNLLNGRPKVKDVEILYHASVNARQIAANGFSAKRPEENYGLGGSSSNKEDSNSISFTYSAKFANDIARWLKEMAMIAHKKVTAAQILRWADMEGISDDLYKMLKGLVPLSVGSYMKEGRTTLVRDGNRWMCVLEKWDPEKNEVVREQGDLDVIFAKPEAVYSLFHAYIVTHPMRLREDILVISPSAVLRRMTEGGINPSDIGVIAAEVDMTDPAISHHPSEREFRVPPRAVKRVVRLIGA